MNAFWITYIIGVIVSFLFLKKIRKKSNPEEMEILSYSSLIWPLAWVLVLLETIYKKKKRKTQ